MAIDHDFRGDCNRYTLLPKQALHLLCGNLPPVSLSEWRLPLAQAMKPFPSLRSTAVQTPSLQVPLPDKPLRKSLGLNVREGRVQV